MPFKKAFRRKRPIRKRKRFFPKKRMIPRGLRQAIIPLQREKTVIVNTQENLPANWAYGNYGSTYNTIQCNQQFTLSDLPQVTDFDPLFRLYRLNCVVVTIQNLHNTSQYTAGSAQNYYGGSLIVYSQKNYSGVGLDTNIGQEYWDQVTAKKRNLLNNGKTITYKVYPKLLTNLQLSSSTSSPAMAAAKWIPLTAEGITIPHYGLNLQVSYTDPSLAFNNKVVVDNGKAPLNLRITYKYLFQLRGIH